MRIAFLVLALDAPGGLESAVVTQAGALAAAGHAVRIVCVERRAAELPHDLPSGVVVDHLVDLTDPEAPVSEDVPPDRTARLAAGPSVLVPPRWGAELSGLADTALQRALPRLEADVLVTVAPTLLAVAVQLAPESCLVVHQQQGPLPPDSALLEPLLAFGPRADVITVPSQPAADWMATQLGPIGPRIEVVPQPLAAHYRPRSTLETKLFVAAGRLTPDHGFPRLVQAFAAMADRAPSWRLRILGAGGMRVQLVRSIRRFGLYDRVELPGWSNDMPSEWARASAAVVTSRASQPPLVVPEAMAAGLPVVGLDTPFGTREQLRHDVDGLLVGSDTSVLAGALLRVATDDALRHRLGQAGFEASQIYRPERFAAHLTEILESALRDGGPHGSRIDRRSHEVAERRIAPPSQVEAAETWTPAVARARALDWAVSRAVAVGGFWYVEPPHDELSIVLVLPADSRYRFLEALGSAGAPAELSLVDTSGPDWLERRGPIPELSRALQGTAVSSVALEPWPRPDGAPGLLSQRCRIDIEFWERGVDGQLSGPRTGRYTRVVSPDQELVPAVVETVEVQTLPLMTAPTVLDCDFPIDVVYTWVDGSDPAWNAARDARIATASRTAHARASSGAARFVSRDELRYSMRSLHLFAPWVRRIHLVTAGQVPPWLVDHPKVHLVDHAEIIPADALPVFNSHAIECALHRIDDLTEHFVYFNDDFLLGRPLLPPTFFTGAGQPKVFLSEHHLGLDEIPDPAPWLSAALHNRRLLRDTFGVTTTNSLKHAPYAHRRSLLAEVEQRFPEEIAATARSPFRSPTDVSLLSSLAQHYGLATGAAVLGEAESQYIDVSSNQLPWRLTRLLERQQDFICLGDHHDHALPPDQMNRMVLDFFTTYCPVPAPWEDPAA